MKMKGKVIRLVLISLTGCFVLYFVYTSLNTRHKLTRNEAKQIIFSVKEFIVSGFKGNSEYDKRFLQASYELGTNWIGSDITFARDNIFTVKYSHWLFGVKGDIVNGVYIDESYIAFVILEKSKNSWKVKDAGIFKREIYQKGSDSQSVFSSNSEVKNLGGSTSTTSSKDFKKDLKAEKESD